MCGFIYFMIILICMCVFLLVLKIKILCRIAMLLMVDINFDLSKYFSLFITIVYHW